MNTTKHIAFTITMRSAWVLIYLSVLTLIGDAAETRPNILFILADDMGYGDLGCYGSQQVPTPHLDRLASHGVRCTDGYVSGPVCAPSRAGILTGRYQERFGFEHNLSSPQHVKPGSIGIPLDEVLMSDRLHELGYRTGIVGKWHVGEHQPEQLPNARGFDFFFGIHGGSHHYWPTPEKHRLFRNHEKVTEIRKPYLTDWFTEEALDFIDPDNDQQQPWFLFLSYTTPHSPMQAKEEDLAQFAHVKNKTRRAYCAMQKCMDDNIGRIVSKLEATGQLENTLLVFVSDNGGSCEVSHACNAPLRGTKGTFLEGGIRVPFIFHWPARVPGGQVYSEPIISLDLTPTFVNAAQGTVVEEMIGRGNRAKKRIRDGVDLLPYLTGTAPADTVPHEILYWRMALRGSAIRKGDWKLILTPHHPTMLFNLADDISELNNLSNSKPELVQELTNDYHAWVEGFERNPMWISAPFWSGYNRKLYDREFMLTQPAGKSN